MRAVFFRLVGADDSHSLAVLAQVAGGSASDETFSDDRVVEETHFEKV